MVTTKKPTRKVEVKKTVKSAKAAPAKKITAQAKNSTVICTDKNCHIHSNNKTRGRIFEGKVIRAKMSSTITVEWPRRYYLSKYERFEKRRSRVKAHNPQCIKAKVGDTVRIAECRPISKTKNFVVIEVLLNESN